MRIRYGGRKRSGVVVEEGGKGSEIYSGEVESRAAKSGASRAEGAGGHGRDGARGMERERLPGVARRRAAEERGGDGGRSSSVDARASLL